MLPPLNIPETKPGFALTKRGSGVGTPSPRVQRIVPTAKKPASPSALPVGGDVGVSIDQISSIPREFFVLETNGVLPVERYPPSHYQSAFLQPSKQWETIVFPALTPSSRQQVIYLRQTLEKMRTQIPEVPATNSHTISPQKYVELVVEYTKGEAHMYSICFQELARQIQCICREQSDLLAEIRERHDAAILRLLRLINELRYDVSKREQQIEDLAKQHQESVNDNEALVDRALKAYEHEAAQFASPSFMQPRPLRRIIDDEDGEEGDEHELYEARWRRQRRGHGRFSEVYRKPTSHDSLVEENIAAARVQSAFQRYQLRKEQHRIAMREQKRIAALEIQRSFRGFRDRKHVLHRRAVVQTIYRRRKEKAAIELLQANVRSYLMKRRRQLKRHSYLHFQRNKSQHPQSTSPPEEPSGQQAEQLTTVDDDDEQEEEPIEPQFLPNEDLLTLLHRFSEMTAAFAILNERSRRVRRRRQIMEILDAEDADANSRGADPAASPSDSLAERTAVPDEDVRDAMAQKIRQAENLVALFHTVIMRMKGSSHLVPTLSHQESKMDIKRSISHTQSLLPFISKATSTSDLLAESDINYEDMVRPLTGNTVDAAPSTAHRDEDQPESNYADASSRMVVPSFGKSPQVGDNGDFHLDDTLWNLSLFSPEQNVHEQNDTTEELLAIIGPSRDQKKKLVWLKQFISDIYATVLGKINSAPEASVALFLRYRCGLAMSCDDWHQFIRMGAAPSASTLMPDCDILSVINHHFYCQLGLKSLVDAAMASLIGCLELFVESDLDVRRFQAFMNHERSLDELVFFCMCRRLASTVDNHDANHTRQPVLDPLCMREVISLTHAFAVAKQLFHVNEEPSILAADVHVIESDNLIYRRYLPSSGYNQLEALLPKFSTSHVAMKASATSPTSPSSPETVTLMRATNANQFHSKQYNFTAARSPLVRRNQHRSFTSTALTPLPTGKPNSLLPSFSTSNLTHLPQEQLQSQWVYFDAFVDLLLRYRSQMNHFHLFAQWARELFHEAAVQSFSVSRTSTVGSLVDVEGFVSCLSPYSLGAVGRDLRNVFVNTVKQRRLDKLMPSRVFVSVVLSMLSNGVLSVTSYRPLERPARSPHAPMTLRQQQLEQEWVALALKWRGQEQSFEAVVEGIYHSPTSDKAVALQLLQLRNDLYELFIYRSGKEELLRAIEICHHLDTILVQQQKQQEQRQQHQHERQQQQQKEDELRSSHLPHPPSSIDSGWESDA
ncbi:TPA: hypothetical protein N0F65_006991 [Lagenidium giganteum]|uniref:Uncharacterized protein n=1 Tax=Lagenidium giganteum TaxID=4803 RepID=A0AAV2ZHE8_9STRA|nr:TPA: hypothetical protein N0F65_006991 [Lagenidium giganteum]